MPPPWLQGRWSSCLAFSASATYREWVISSPRIRQVPANAITATVGLMTVVNAVFGGYQATMTGVSTSILASPVAGPLEPRYWSAIGTFTLPFGSACQRSAGTTDHHPGGGVDLVAGLAILPSFEDAHSVAFGGQYRSGSVIAFGVTVFTFTIVNNPPAFWAILIGIGGPLVLERRVLLLLRGYPQHTSRVRGLPRANQPSSGRLH